ncbi:hypothetical protein FJY71_04105, partial [candidate division WOR-3 bacterium]|nr:hypothetical protein [candidate division WOR-3 bacterium]
MVLLAVGLAGTVYLPTLRYDFVWDDIALVVENPDLKLASPLPLFGRSFMQHQSRQELRPDKYYRPLVVASLWFDARVWGPRPFGFHLTNLVLNTAAALLAVLLLLRLFPGRFWPPLLAGLGFALHPAHVESVTFVSGRTDILAAVFVLSALLLLLSWRDRPAWWKLC